MPPLWLKKDNNCYERLQTNFFLVTFVNLLLFCTYLFLVRQNKSQQYHMKISFDIENSKGKTSFDFYFLYLFKDHTMDSFHRKSDQPINILASFQNSLPQTRIESQTELGNGWLSWHKSLGICQLNFQTKI